jgi:hypothetical protein
MSEDHARLDRLLAASEAREGVVDVQTFAQLRHDLLRHIAMEEKILLPYARDKGGGSPLTVAPALRADHGQIAKLLVPSPTVTGLRELRELLARHNPLEEGPGGVYAVCDALAGPDAPAVVALLRAHPMVPVAKHYDGPRHPRH